MKLLPQIKNILLMIGLFVSRIFTQKIPSFFRNFPQMMRKLVAQKGFKSFVASLLAIVCGLLIGLLVMIITSPNYAIPGFFEMIGGWVFRYGSKEIGNWLYYGAPLLCTGLSVGFAFKTGLFNIGASGQYTVGMFCAIVVGVLGSSFGQIQWLVAILAGILGGAIWGFLPGLFKAYFNTNEVISSIMLNYIGMYMVNALIYGLGGGILYDSNKAQTKAFASTAYLPTWGLRNIFPNSAIDIGFILAILAAIIIYIILNKTTFGYELKACGLNRDAARYGGINEKKNIILSMTIAGALSGLGGAIFILAGGAFRSGTFYTPEDSLSAMGFNGIAVALLGMSNPIGIIFASGFITFIERGGHFIQSYGFKTEIVDIIVSIIVYFSAFALLASEVIRRFHYNRQKKKEKHKSLEDNETATSEESKI